MVMRKRPTASLASLGGSGTICGQGSAGQGAGAEGAQAKPPGHYWALPATAAGKHSAVQQAQRPAAAGTPREFGGTARDAGNRVGAHVD